MRSRLLVLLILLLTLLTAKESPKAVIIFDASGSMWGQIDGKAKITIAKDALKKIINGWNPNIELGLTVYGHRKKGDCNDIQSLIPISKIDKSKLLKAVSSIKPKGKTPISRSLKMVAKELQTTEDKATIILISDGKETCDLDPCLTVKELKDKGIDFVTYVIGFNVDKNTDKQLSCIAKATGGEYFSAKNASALNQALKEVVKKVEKRPVSKKVPTGGKVFVSASETEGGKRVTATCKIYNEDNSRDWSIYPRKKEDSMSYRELPVGKYSLNCKYNAFKKENIPFEIKAGKTTKVHIIFGQTGKVFVSASEKEGGKRVTATCKIYNEDKSRDWSIYPRKKEDSMSYRELPVGKYSLNCKYNAFKKENIPFEIKAGKTTKVHIIFGQTGKVFVSASEKEGGKWINAECRIYNEDKSRDWNIYPRRSKDSSMGYRKLPVGKYFLNCEYNSFTKKDIPVEIKANKTTKIHIIFPYFYLKSKCTNPKDRVRYEIYGVDGALVYDRTKPCSKRVKVTLDKGRYTIEGKVKDTKAIAKVTIPTKDNNSVILDFTKQSNKANEDDNRTQDNQTVKKSATPQKSITVGNKVINIEGLSQEQIKRLQDMKKMLEMFGNKQ